MTLYDSNGTPHDVPTANYGTFRVYANYSGWTEAERSPQGNSHFFTGRQYDADTGLYYYRHRWYDPVHGRFLTRDPLGVWGDPRNLGNPYAYAGNNPWSYVDPYGLEGCGNIYTWHHGIPQTFLKEDWFLNGIYEMGVDGQRGKRLNYKELENLISEPEYGWMIKADEHFGKDSLHRLPEGEDWIAAMRNRLQIEQKKLGFLTPESLDRINREFRTRPYFQELMDLGETYSARISYRKWSDLSAEKKSNQIIKDLDSLKAAGKLDDLQKRATAARKARAGRLVGKISRGAGHLLPIFAAVHIANGYSESFEEGLIRTVPYTEDIRDATVLAGEGAEVTYTNVQEHFAPALIPTDVKYAHCLDQ